MNPLISKFPSQLRYKAEIKNGPIASAPYYIVGAMGGSHLAASLIADQDRMPNMIIHSDYDLPRMTDAMKSGLFIAVSHSGNTEETLDFASKVIENGYRLAVVTGGGKLLQLAQDRQIPHIVIPSGDFPPRLSTGYMAVALYTILGNEDRLASLENISMKIENDMQSYASRSREIARQMANRIPISYASRDNYSLASYWKIAMNETAKVPAFCNAYPELNHNEMAGFTGDDSAKNYFLATIAGPEDNEHVTRRMNITRDILKQKGAKTYDIALKGHDRVEQFWDIAFLSICTSFALADIYGVDPVSTAFIEEFKKKL